MLVSLVSVFEIGQPRSSKLLLYDVIATYLHPPLLTVVNKKIFNNLNIFVLFFYFFIIIFIVFFLITVAPRAAIEKIIDDDYDAL